MNLFKGVLFLTFIALISCGCYQIHSDDGDLRTIPATNNPNVIPESSRKGTMPVSGY